MPTKFSKVPYAEVSNFRYPMPKKVKVPYAFQVSKVTPCLLNVNSTLCLFYVLRTPCLRTEYGTYALMKVLAVPHAFK